MARMLCGLSCQALQMQVGQELFLMKNLKLGANHATRTSYEGTTALEKFAFGMGA